MLKRPEAFIPPATVMAGTLLLLVVARFYDQIPVKPPPCSFKSLTGFPCISCGGTRAFKSLSRGDVVAAFELNPAITAAVFGIAIWFIVVLVLTDKPQIQWTPERRRKWTTLFVISGVLIASANWLYLVLYLPK